MSEHKLEHQPERMPEDHPEHMPEHQRERQDDRPATTGEGHHGQWPGSPPAAERKADTVRDQLVAGAPTDHAAATTSTPEQGTALESTDGARIGEPAGFGTPAGSDTADMFVHLFESEDVEKFRRRWDHIQALFVDDPHDAVQRADVLAEEVVSELITTVDSHKRDLSERWQESEKADTEQLRIVLRDYRKMLERLLTV